MKKFVCNICGKDFDLWDRQEHFGLHYDVGYGSKFDGEHIDLDMCCNCFDKLMEYILPICKYPPVELGD